MTKTNNAGKYNRRIQICGTEIVTDSNGFQTERPTVILETYASIKTTKGWTLIKNGTDFEAATTNFTIRFPVTKITRDMVVKYGGKTYEIQYLNNVDEMGIELEIQAKEVTH